MIQLQRAGMIPTCSAILAKIRVFTSTVPCPTVLSLYILGSEPCFAVLIVVVGV
jgi:hypothetical protein